MNCELIEKSYPSLILKKTRKQKYYNALEKANNENYFFISGFIEDNQYVLELHIKDASTTFEQELKKICYWYKSINYVIPLLFSFIQRSFKIFLKIKKHPFSLLRALSWQSDLKSKSFLLLNKQSNSCFLATIK